MKKPKSITLKGAAARRFVNAAARSLGRPPLLPEDDVKAEAAQAASEDRKVVRTRAHWIDLNLDGGGAQMSFKNFRVSVHHHRDYPMEIWVLTSPELFGYQMHQLKAKTVGEAKTEAIHFVYRFLADAKDAVAEVM
jgi:hypothetical protein